MSLIKAEPGDVVSFTYTATDRATNLYPKAFVYDTAGNEITTVNLSHIANGFYSGQYTATGVYKLLVIHIIPYSNAGRTVEADYSSAESKLYVGYDYKASGFGSQTTTLPKEEIDKIIKLIVEAVKDKIGTTEILEELKKKSEFDPLKDKVKTDIKIPSLRETNDILNQVKKTLSSLSIKDYNTDFIELRKAINNSALSKVEIKTILDYLKKISRPLENKIIDIGKTEKLLESLDTMLEVFNSEEFKRHEHTKNELTKLAKLITTLIAIVSSDKRERTEFTDRFENMFSSIDTLNEKIE